MTRPTSPLFFVLFRVVFGLYLAVHFFTLAPVADQLFSNAGMLPRISELPTYPYFPNIFFFIDSPSVATAFVTGLGILSLVLVSGRASSLVSLLLWYGWACLLTRNVFIRNPGMPFVGWILLAIPFVPKLQYQSGSQQWSIPRPIYLTAWVLMSLGYMLSGLHKLQSPSWINGMALQYLFENPLSRPTMVAQILASLPSNILRLQTWAVLFLETSFALWALWKPSRRWVWLAMVAMHIGIMLSVDFVDLTLGMLMIHLFTFDQRWISARPSPQPLVVYFDGVCNFCNSTINMLILEDDARVLRYAPLQGETAKSRLTETDRGQELESIVVVDGVDIYRASDALIRIGEALGGIWRLVVLAKVVPRRVRDYAYRLIANNRYKLLGKRAVCRLPTSEERSLFLP